MNILKIAVALVLSLAAAYAQVIYPPGGRLTLTNNTPIMDGDVVNTSFVYYVTYGGSTVPNPTGSGGFGSPNTFSVQLTLGLDSSTNTAGNIYDIFGVIASSSLTLCTGPAWTSSSARGTGAGTTQILQSHGIWINSFALSSCYNGGVSVGSIAAETGVYLGSVYMTANGQTGVSLKPAAASGGNNNVMGLYNAYNRVRTTAYSRDSTSSWLYSTASWRAADTSTSNKINFLDGLSQSQVTGNYSVLGSTSTNAIGAYIGLNEDSSTTTPNIASGMSSAQSQSSDNQYSVTETFYPRLGLHYIQAVEYAGGSSAVWYGVLSSLQLMSLSVSLDM